MKLSKLICGSVALATLSTVNATVAFFDDFQTGHVAVPNTDLHGQNGWTINAPNLPTVGALPVALSSYVQLVGGSGDNWGTLGGQWSYPNTANVELSHSAAMPLYGTQFNVDFDIVGSTLAFPNRDKFGWSFKDGSSADLLRISFEPGLPGLMEIKYAIGAGSPVSTGFDLAYNSIYNLDVNFGTVTGGDLRFVATLTPGIGAPLVWNGTLTGAAGATLARINADFDTTSALPSGAGDNYMAFSVPEPTSVLTAGLAFLGLAVRRRRK